MDPRFDALQQRLGHAFAQPHLLVRALTHRSHGEDMPYTPSYAGGWHLHLIHLIAQLEGAPRPPFWSTHPKLQDQYAKLYASAHRV